ncbi:DUF2889 domain-containing protein [Pseudorhodoferax sp.]|uniref:DUF2889 domain-containing protein n=1 Tax=Pseudorhodoferax sp. TaxID=1993553 RepID=UPI002DD6938F|nr:DUF2889 domain-containing protein [Pseudorhodoferax sp.]
MQREELHHRQIDLRFYRRGDGLYEVVGRLVDTKSHPFRRQLAQADTPAHTPVHDIAVHLVIDADMRVHEAFAAMDATPFGLCTQAPHALARLRGLSLRKGWNRQVRELLGGAASCTHIVELLGPMATTAFQGLAPLRLTEINRPDSEALRRAKVDSCYAYGAGREVVARLWPHLHRAAAGTGPQETFRP